MRKLFLTILLILRANASYADTTTGLVGWWRYNDGAGYSAVDSSGNSNTGTLNNFANPFISTSGWTTAGKLGGALVFDGVDDYVSVPTSTSLQFSGQFSIAIWINTTGLNTTGQAVFIANENYQHSGIALIDNGQYTPQIIFRVGPSGSNCGSGSNGGTACTAFARSLVNDGKWHQIMGVRSGTQMLLYLDGVVQSTGTLGTFTQNTQQYTIGILTGSSGGGKLDDVRIYNRALSAGDVLQLYNTSITVLKNARLHNMKIKF